MIQHKRFLTPHSYKEPINNIEAYDLVSFFIEKNKSFPNNTIYSDLNYNKGYICFDLLVKKLKNSQVFFKSTTSDGKPRRMFIYYESSFLLLDSIYTTKSYEYESLPNELNNLNDILIVDVLTILHTGLDIDKNLKDIIESCLIKQIKPEAVIGIINRNNTGFFIDYMSISSEYSSELDLHYGEGFSNFHEKLLDKLVNDTKGIVLLHGDPGTGKSSYIRRLASDIKKNANKHVVIVPSALISVLADPEFNSFLKEETENYVLESEDGVECDGIVLLLEDAENVLTKREISEYSQGVSNILNMSAGLLNDMFNIQIVATYNTKDDNIDPAIKRKKRLIAKRSFRKLTIDESKKLAEHLNIDIREIKEPMTVADIYSILDDDDSNILIEKEEKKSNRFKITEKEKKSK